MKILTLSDTVEEAIYSSRIMDRFGDVDMVISCGVVPLYYLEYIVSMLNKPLFYVFGNHGREAEAVAPGAPPIVPAGCINLDNRVVSYKGLILGGLEGSMRYNRRAHFQYTEGEMQRKIARMVPRLLWHKARHGRALDILVTHAPPCGIHDGEDVCHMGFKGYLWLMDTFAPRYLIHGHTHIYLPHQRRRSIYRQTEIVNTYGYRVMDIDVPPRSLTAETVEEIS